LPSLSSSLMITYKIVAHPAQLWSRSRPHGLFLSSAVNVMQRVNEDVNNIRREPQDHLKQRPCKRPCRMISLLFQPGIHCRIIIAIPSETAGGCVNCASHTVHSTSTPRCGSGRTPLAPGLNIAHLPFVYTVERCLQLATRVAFGARLLMLQR